MKKVLIFAALSICLIQPVDAFAQRIQDTAAFMHPDLVNPPKPKKAHKAAPRPATMAAPVAAPAADMPVMTAPATGIAAVVNDNIITTTDVNQRMRLAILSSGLPDNADVRAHLLPQILRGLIEEQLQSQEAKRLDLSVTDAEINTALERIAHDNHIPGDMKQFVSAHGASPDALIGQVRTGMLWNKVIQRELRPRVDVGDDEIDAVVARVKADSGKQEYLVSEIMLTVDNPKDEDQVKQVAQKLVREIRGGAAFGAVARQFSQGIGAAQGGDIGWIQQGQLEPELNKALLVSGPGEVSDPIRTSSGFHILGVREKRTVSLGDPTKSSVNLMQAFRAYGADKQAVLKDGDRLRTAFKGCPTLDSTMSAFPDWKTQKLGDMKAAEAPAWMSSKIAAVPAGGASDVLPTDKGAVVLFVCSRSDGGDLDREAILHSIGTEKLELQARRLLRDLRRSAYIDIRLGK